MVLNHPFVFLTMDLDIFSRVSLGTNDFEYTFIEQST